MVWYVCVSAWPRRSSSARAESPQHFPVVRVAQGTADSPRAAELAPVPLLMRKLFD